MWRAVRNMQITAHSPDTPSSIRQIGTIGALTLLLSHPETMKGPWRLVLDALGTSRLGSKTTRGAPRLYRSPASGATRIITRLDWRKVFGDESFEVRRHLQEWAA
jgi:hypothetical protein